MVVGGRLAEARKRAGLTQDELAAALSDRYDRTMISKVERGHASLLSDGLIDVARELNVSADWLLGLSDEAERFGVTFVTLRPEPVFAGIAVGSVTTPDADTPFAFSCQRLESDGVDPANVAVFQVVGDSMSPALTDTAVILVDKGQTKPRRGDIFAIEAGEALFVKRYRRRRHGWEWASDGTRDQSIPAGSAVKVVGRVCWSMRRFGSGWA